LQVPAGFVDLHVHVQPHEQLTDSAREVIEGGRPDLPLIDAVLGDPAALLAEMDRVGMARMGLVNYPAPAVMGFGPTTNDWVAHYRDAAPDRLLAWGGMHPALTPDADSEMRRLLDELRLDGIKVHPPHQEIAPNGYLDGSVPQLATLYAACEQRGVPVMIHTGTSVFPGARSRLGDPMLCDDVAVDFPELKLVLAHCGRPLWYEQAFFVARRHPNVWLELSGIPPHKLPELLPLLEEVGDRVLWGTDWPSPGVKDLRSNAEVFCALDGYPDAFKQAVLVDNPARLFPPKEA
jgi:predicted TIM-barrel fold metal-dependent hydrolase